MNSSERVASQDQSKCSAVANLELLCLNPEFHQKIWGGRHLETEFNYAIPDGRIGECWAISAHPHGDCKLLAGPLAGNTLSQVWDSHPELFGNIDSDRFPLLIKILDAEDDLSIQVHLQQHLHIKMVPIAQARASRLHVYAKWYSEDKHTAWLLHHARVHLQHLKTITVHDS